ncbi:MAG: type III-A CRISPR-associated RAMP protein Csm5 [bacterium]
MALNEFGKGEFEIKRFLDDYKILYKDVEKYHLAILTPGKEINEFVKTGFGNPYIPGSSIKGALRTVILWHLIKNSPPDKINDRLDEILNNPKVKKEQADNLLDKYLFGKDDKYLFGKEPNYDFLRGLQVGDVEFEIKNLAVEEIRTLTLTNADNYGWKRWQTFAEVLPLSESVSSLVNIEIDNFLFEHPKAKGILKFDHKKGYLTQIPKMCNDYARVFIQNEIKFFADCKMQPLKKYYEELLAKIPTDHRKGVLLHLGWGSGWRGMTGNYLDNQMLRRFRGKFRMGKSIKNPRTGKWEQFPIFPKTRRIVFRDNQPAYPLGWIMMEEK